MGAPRFGSVNVVVSDVVAATGFLESLGVSFEPTFPGWDRHHRVAATVDDGFDVDLDSPAFASWWGGTATNAAPGVVVNVVVDTDGEVDDLHTRALELGAEELKAPWDAFWGARYSVVQAPGPICVGIMGPADESRRTMPPAIDDFA